MIAIVPGSKSAAIPADMTAVFTSSILPVVRQRAGFVFRDRAAVARDEAVQECAALAWKYFVLVVRRGKNPQQFRYRFADFVVLACMNGRRAAGQIRGRDVFSPAAQRRAGFAVRSLDGFGGTNSQDGRGSWQEAITEDRRRGCVADIVAFRIDFAAWLRSLTIRNRQIVEWLALGHGTLDTAKRFHITPGRVSQLRRDLHRRWTAFQGEDTDAA